MLCGQKNNLLGILKSSHSICMFQTSSLYRILGGKWCVEIPGDNRSLSLYGRNNKLVIKLWISSKIQLSFHMPSSNSYNFYKLIKLLNEYCLSPSFWVNFCKRLITEQQNKNYELQVLNNMHTKRLRSTLSSFMLFSKAQKKSNRSLKSVFNC